MIHSWGRGLDRAVSSQMSYVQIPVRECYTLGKCHLPMAAWQVIKDTLKHILAKRVYTRLEQTRWTIIRNVMDYSFKKRAILLFLKTT